MIRGFVIELLVAQSTQFGSTMQSLVDIEQAVQNLSVEQQAELLLFVAERLRSQRARLPEPREFTEEQLRVWLDEDERAMERFRAGP
jgi:hypothetical protein